MISLQYGGSNAHDKIETTRGNSKAKKEIPETAMHPAIRLIFIFRKYRKN